MFNDLVDRFSRGRFDVLLVCILVTAVIILALQIFPTHNSTIYKYDDTEYMNVADNIMHGHGMVTTLIYPISTYTGNGAFIDSYDPSVILKHYSSLYNQFNISPLFMLLFAGYLAILHANPGNWVLIGSLFNVVIFSFFICLYYLWVSKQFGRMIAFVSSVVVICTTTFLIHLTLVEMYPFSWLLILISFYFIKNTKRDYILFGIFSALAVLSNQLGIIAIVSYATFLLIKKELRGLSYVLGTWFSVVLPWMVYSHIHYDDFGSGLGIPFTSRISSLINSFFFHQQKIPSTNFFQTLHHDSMTLPINVFFNVLSSETHVAFMIIIILFFSALAFISITSLHKITKKTAILYGLLACIVSICVILYVFSQTLFDIHLWNYVIQGLIFLGIPIMVGILLWLKKDTFLEKKIPRLYVIVLFVAFHSMVIIYYLGASWIGFDEKYVWPMYFLMLPLGIYGISKLRHVLPIKIPSNPIILVVITLLFLVPFLVSAYDTTFLQLQHYVSTDAYPKDLTDFVRQHFTKNIVFGASEPGPFFLATGNPAVAMKMSQPFDLSGYHNVVKTFDIKYVVVNSNSPENTFTFETDPMYKYDLAGSKLSADVVYHSPSGYSVISLLSCLSPANEDDTYDMIIYGICLEKDGNLNNASVIYAKPISSESVHHINLLFYLGWKYDSEYNIDEISNSGNTTVALTARVDLVQRMLSVIKQDIDNKLRLAQELEFRGGYEQAISAYKSILDVDPFNQKAIDSIFRIYSNYGTIDMVDDYEQFESDVDKKFEFEKINHSIFDNFDEKHEKISIIKNKINVWKHYSDDAKVYDLYYDWYNNVDQFDTEGLEGFAQYSLKEHYPVPIIKNLYERLLHLEHDDYKKKEIEQIIMSLK